MATSLAYMISWGLSLALLKKKKKEEFHLSLDVLLGAPDSHNTLQHLLTLCICALGQYGVQIYLPTTGPL